MILIYIAIAILSAALFALAVWFAGQFLAWLSPAAKTDWPEETPGIVVYRITHDPTRAYHDHTYDNYRPPAIAAGGEAPAPLQPMKLKLILDQPSLARRPKAVRPWPPEWVVYEPDKEQQVQ